MKLRDDLSRRLHVESEMRSFVMIVVKESINTLLNEKKIALLEGNTAQLLASFVRAAEQVEMPMENPI